MGRVDTFETGAIRDIEGDKLDIEGFLSPLVIEEYSRYMHKCRQTATGLRDSDNWQKGIPVNRYMKSLIRHAIAVWKTHRYWGKKGELLGTEGYRVEMYLKEELCAVIFNAMGYLFELVKNGD